MVDILHKVGIKASSQDDAYKALSTIKGLSGWWTTNTQGESKVGGVIQFRFGAGGFDMKVLELDPPKRVLWSTDPKNGSARKSVSTSDRRATGPSSSSNIRVEGAGGVHASLQHQVGGLSAEPKVGSRNW
jgi:hypothetical protein